MFIKALKYACIIFFVYIAGTSVYAVHGAARFYDRSPVLYAKDGSIIAYSLSSDDKFRFLSEHKKIDPLYIKMLIGSEDERFYYHAGVDPISIVRSFISNMAGFGTSGASTLAMQLSRMLDRKERTLLSKIKEAIQATYLTLYYGQDRILDMYLTLAPFGSNIEGVTAASLMYFSHMPDKLTPDEAALLVALPKAPEKIRPDRNLKRAVYYTHKVLDKACKDGLISTDILDASKQRKIADRIKIYPQLSWHLGKRAFALTKVKEHYSDIDVNVQKTANALAHDFKKRASSKESLALCVIDNTDNTLAAYVGSPDSKKHYVDFIKAKRSTGSLLKPFIYAMAFDRGIVLPNSLIDDRQKSFETWQPKNYSREFQGKVSAKDALIMSLNLPSIDILKALGPDDFLKTINNKGSLLYIKGGADLSLATGGAHSDLVSLTELYAMLKNKGRYNSVPLFYIKNKNQAHLTHLINERSSDLKTHRNKDNIYFYSSIPRFDYEMIKESSASSIYSILKRVKRVPGFESMSSLSYKTGTSYNYIDAHAIGTQGRYTIAVRTGREDGSSNAPYTGFSRAAPFLFDLLSKLDIKDDSSESNNSLLDVPPQALAYLSFSDERDIFEKNKDKLKIAFPLDNTQIIPIDGRIYLDIRGGNPPYEIFVDGIKNDNSSYIEVTNFGLCSITVRDSNGDSQAVSIYIPAKNP